MPKKKTKKKAVKKTASKKTKKKTGRKGFSLKESHKKFCQEYIIHFNGTRAHQTVSDCSRASSEVVAIRWLKNPEIQKYLASIIAKRQERLECKADEAMIECRRIALADVADAFNEDGSIKAIHDIPLDLRRCISSIEIEDIWEGKGKNKVYVGRLVKIKFWSKDKNIEMLFKHHGLFEKDNKQNEKRGTMLIINRPSKQ